MKELKIGVVGAGTIGRDHTRRIMEKINGAYVTAIADVNKEVGVSTAEKWGAQFFDDGEELIASDMVDAVVITTLDEYHEQYATAAIRAGKYVLCEKPLAPDAESCCRIMKEEIAGGKKLLQVGFMRRFDAGYRELKQIISEKRYGEPLMVHCAHRAVSIAPNYITSMLVTNCAVHEIDVLRWLLGEDYKSCQVVKARPTKHAWETLNDPVIVMLETVSGVRIDVEVFVNCRYGYDIRCEVVCEEGTVSLPTPTGTLVRTVGQRSIPVSDDWQARFVDAYDLEFQQWVDNCRVGIVNGPTAWDGYACAVAATAAVEALNTKLIQPIVLDEQPEFYQ